MSEHKAVRTNQIVRALYDYGHMINSNVITTSPKSAWVEFVYNKELPLENLDVHTLGPPWKGLDTPDLTKNGISLIKL